MMEIDIEKDLLVNIIKKGLTSLHQNPLDNSQYVNNKNNIISRKQVTLDGDTGALLSFKEYQPLRFEQVQNRVFHKENSGLKLKSPFKYMHTSQTTCGDVIDQNPWNFLSSLTLSPKIISCGALKNSGSRFYYTFDRRFIIKTLPRTQFHFLVRIIDDYINHLSKHPDSLLVRIHGLYRVRIGRRGFKHYFIVMENSMFGLNGETDGIYDIKPHCLLHPRDNGDYKKFMAIKENPVKYLSEDVRLLIRDTLKRDVQFMRHVRVNDYSILLGIGNEYAAVALIDVLSEFHVYRKFGYVLFAGILVAQLHLLNVAINSFFPRFIRPSNYAKQMEKTIDIIFE